MIRLYVDEQVRADVISGLRDRQIDCLWAVEDGHKNTADEIILSRANDLGRVVLTYDEDFTAIANRWLRDGRPFPGVIRSAYRSMSIGDEIREVELICKVMSPDDLRDSVTYLPLRGS